MNGVDPPLLTPSSADRLSNAVARTNRLLTEFATAFPDCVDGLRDPNSILALSGARAQSPYHDAFSGDPRRLSDINEFLLDKGIVIVDEDPTSAESRSISIVNIEALTALPEKYPVFRELWQRPPELTTYSFHAWCGAMDMRIASYVQRGGIADVSLADWWTPHDIRFGACLGYPWRSILAFVQVEAHQSPPSSLVSVSAFAGSSVTPSIGFMAPADDAGLREAYETLREWNYLVQHCSPARSVN